MMDLQALEGGLAEGMSWRDFDYRALSAGTKVEMEHTRYPYVAQRIAMDHLVEHPLYYQELAKMEAKLERMKPNVDWGSVGKKVLLPLSGDMKPNPGGDVWTLLSVAGSGASAYHGYKRNAASNPVAWALWWALWGAVIPIVTVPIALAQGYAEPAGT